MKSSYLSQKLLNWKTGLQAMPVLPAVFLGLFTAAPSESGGGTEVTGGSYARVQVGGTLVTNGTTAAGNATLHFASVPAWIVAGMTVLDVTAGTISAGATVLSTTGTTVVLTSGASVTGGGVGSGDTIVFSAFPAASGAGPSSAATGAQATFPAPSANWGTVNSWATFDASSSGNELDWDYLGNYQWQPATVSAASPGVITQKAHGYSNGDLVIAQALGGFGTLPTFSQSNFTGVLTVANVTTDTFTVTNSGTAVNTSSTGSCMVRKINTLQITSGMQAPFFTSGQLTLTEE